MNLLTLVIIILLVVVVAGLPPVGTATGWHSYGWAPSSVVTVLVVILLVLLLTGRV